MPAPLKPDRIYPTPKPHQTFRLPSTKARKATPGVEPVQEPEAEIPEPVQQTLRERLAEKRREERERRP
jgi:hypothetical protein